MRKMAIDAGASTSDAAVTTLRKLVFLNAASTFATADFLAATNAGGANFRNQSL